MMSFIPGYVRLIYFLLFSIFLAGCTSINNSEPIFEVLDSSKTGLDFNNKLTYNKEFNVFNYMYFYNGSGVGAGDFNNDGLVDLFFGSNQGNNKIYLNKGKLQFRDVTNEAQIPEDGGWSTGISVIDINNDSLLDIYICRVGNYETLKSKNQLLICKGIDKQGIPFYKNEAQDYGLDFSGFSTQSAFFDYDADGDLDMFLLNHSVHENGTYRPREEFLGTYNLLSGDRIYRNEGNNNFSDVTKETGINSSAIGYGLGIAVADINLDGYPDIYIGNDFHENDYLYINQKNGTFKEEGAQRFMHTTQYSMGVDVADINNDAFPEIISMDMLPSDPYILKRSLGEDTYDIFNYKINSGYSYQYTRNNLQYNRKNGMFSEIGLYSGVAATDWSWAPLWCDFNNDGLKDLFISNGIPKRMNDIDYINFISSGEVQQKIRSGNIEEKDISLINKFPEIKLPNEFFINNGNLFFTNEGNLVKGNVSTFSNGAAYADFDNDGDFDIVVNNINAAVLLYENKNTRAGTRLSLQIKLKGFPQNVNAIGSRVIVYAGKEIRTYEKYPVRGFVSSMEIPILVGLYNTKVDSILLIWPDNTYQPVNFSLTQPAVSITYKKNLPLFAYARFLNYNDNVCKPMIDITKEVNLSYVHEENHFAEFDREPLIPHMFSTQGPALAVADINHDGLEDVFFGSARNKKSTIFLQLPSGKFSKSSQPVLEKDSACEDVNACWADVNNDDNIDLVVVSGGNEFFGNDWHNSPRVYINDGKANFSKLDNAFSTLYLTASCITSCDFNGDGYIDLFIGSNAVPWEYGKVPQSYLLENNKQGRFIDVTLKYAPELAQAGFVTDAIWVDINKDKKKDIVLCLEWGGIIAFINTKGEFKKKVLSSKHGWWNFIIPCDVDNDGDADFIAGNLGLNSRLKASESEPVQMYYNDFDMNGKKEQVLTYYLEGREIPFANKAELEKQIPLLKKKFLYAEDFAKTTLSDLFTPEKLNKAYRLSADYFSNAILINTGNLQFETRALPMEAQLTSFKDAVIVDANNDALPDVLLLGNYYHNNIEMGRYDADFGTLLINKNNGVFASQTIHGLEIKGQVRHVKAIKINRQQAFVIARNNDSAMMIKFADTKKSN